MSDGARTMAMAGIIKTYEAQPNRYGFLEIPRYGTELGINYMDKLTGRPTHVPITVSPETGIFYALFPEDDVDFHLVVNNDAVHYQDFGFDLRVHEKSYNFAVEKKSTLYLTTVESLGPKFHFVSQSGRNGQALVAAAASRHGLSYQEAAIMVSRMHFSSLHYGSKQRNHANVPNNNCKIQLFVKTSRGNLITLKVSSEDKIDKIKKMIEDHEGIPAGDQSLMYSKYQLKDGHTLGCYNIADGSTLSVTGGIKGGQSNSRASSVATEFILIPSDDEEEEDSDGSEPSFPNVGDRGVVCSGARSAQEFYICQFRTDESVRVNPFVIETRMASEYNLF